MAGSIETKAISASNLKLKLTEAELDNYLSDGVKNDLQSKRTNIGHKSPKKIYNPVTCEGCNENIESGEEVLKWEKLVENDKQIEYSWFFSEMISKQISTGKK